MSCCCIPLGSIGITKSGCFVQACGTTTGTATAAQIAQVQAAGGTVPPGVVAGCNLSKVTNTGASSVVSPPAASSYSGGSGAGLSGGGSTLSGVGAIATALGSTASTLLAQANNPNAIPKNLTTTTATNLNSLLLIGGLVLLAFVLLEKK